MTDVLRAFAHATCAVCQGPITYYARRAEDVTPRTSSIDDSDRWAHDRMQDWMRRPHRARPLRMAVS